MPTRAVPPARRLTSPCYLRPGSPGDPASFHRPMISRVSPESASDLLPRALPSAGFAAPLARVIPPEDPAAYPARSAHHAPHAINHLGHGGSAHHAPAGTRPGGRGIIRPADGQTGTYFAPALAPLTPAQVRRAYGVDQRRYQQRNIVPVNVGESSAVRWT